MKSGYDAGWKYGSNKSSPAGNGGGYIHNNALCGKSEKVLVVSKSCLDLLECS